MLARVDQELGVVSTHVEDTKRMIKYYTEGAAEKNRFVSIDKVVTSSIDKVIIPKQAEPPQGEGSDEETEDEVQSAVTPVTRREGVNSKLIARTKQRFKQMMENEK